jgi:hypothetical protein
MKTDNNDITPGQDKFRPVNLDKQIDYKPDPLLRFQIEELSKPIRRSPYAPPVNRKPNDSVVASMLLALPILAITAVIVHCYR